MPRFNANALLQRSSDNRGGEAFADYIAARQNPLVFWKGKLREASRSVSRHAFDSAPDHEEALKHLQRMENHIAARGGKPEFDPAYLGQCFKAMLRAMSGTEEDDEAEDMTAVEAEREDYKKQGYTDADLAGKSDPDHRKDFNDLASGGADSAIFDADALFQRGGR